MKSGPVSIARLVKVAMVTLVVGSAAILFLFPELRSLDKIPEVIDAWRISKRPAAILAITRDLGPVENVELLRLDDGLVPEGVRSYTIPLYEPRDMPVAQVATLTGKDAEAFASLWRKVSLSNNDGAQCHWPHHAVRFHGRWGHRADAVICFYCMNVAIPNGFGHSLAGLNDLEPANKEIRERIERLVGRAPDP